MPAVAFANPAAMGAGPININYGQLIGQGTLSQPIGVTGQAYLAGTGTGLTLTGIITSAAQVDFGYGNPGEAPVTLAGTSPNALGSGQVVVINYVLNLQKPAGVTAISGVIDNYGTIRLFNDDQIDSASNVVNDGLINLDNYSQAVSWLSSSAGVGQINIGSGSLTLNTTGIYPNNLHGQSDLNNYYGSISGTGAILKTGPATQILSGTSTFTGSVSITNGTLQLQSPAALGTPSSISVSGNGTLDLSGQAIASGPLFLSGGGLGLVGSITNSSLAPASFAGAVTLSSSTVIGGAGDITLSGPVSGPGGLSTVGYNTLTLAGGASFTGGLNIPSGTVAVTAPATYSGGISLTGGILAVNADSGMGVTSTNLVFSNGGGLQANGSFTTSRSFQSTGGQFGLAAGVTVVDNGTLSGTGSFTETGLGTWRLTSSNPFAGSLVVAGGTLSLCGTSGAMPAVTAVDLITTGTLELNSSTALGGNQLSQDRFNDAAPITLDGGTLSILGADGLATTETLGALIPHFGASTISLTSGNGSGSAITLNFASLGTSSPGATISFSASDLGNSQKVFFASGVADGTVFNGGVTVNGTDFAKYSATQGVIPFGAADYVVNVFTAGKNVKLDPAVTTPPVPASVGTVSIQTLNIAADIAGVAVNQTAGSTLTLTNGGLIKSGSYPATISGGTLTSSSGELDISVQGGALSVSSALSGSFVLTKRGSGTLALVGNAASTYTGFTLVSGEMDLNKSAGSVAIPGDLIVNGGLLKSLASNQIAGSANVTLNYGTWDLNGQTESINSLNNINGTMLFHGGTLQVANGVNLSGGTTTVASTLNSSALITISGGDNEVHSDGLITTNALAFTGNTTPTVQLYSDASLPGQIVVANGGNLSFTGQGTAQLLSVGNASLPGVMNLSGTSNHTFTIAPGATVLSTATFTNGGFNLTGGGTLQLMGGYSTFSGMPDVLAGSTLMIPDTSQAVSSGNGLNVFCSGGAIALRSNSLGPIFSVSLFAGSAGDSSSIDINRSTPVAGTATGAFTVPYLRLGSGNASFTVNGTDGGSLIVHPAGLTATGNAIDLEFNNGPTFFHTYLNMTVIGSVGVLYGSNVDIVKDQAGTMTLAGNTSNVYGNTTINGGTLSLSKTGGAVAIPGNLNIASGSLVQFNGSNQIATTSMVTIFGASGAGSLNLNGFNNTFGSNGSGGISFIAGGSLSTGSGTATLGTGITYSGVSGTAIINGNLNLGTTTPTFNISSSSASPALQINANISGSVGINKIGTGILYLAGTNSFTGAINVSGGSVKVDGTLSAPLILGSGGSLSLDPNPSAGVLVRNLNAVSLSAASSPFPQVNILPATNRANRQLVVMTGVTICGTNSAWQGLVDLSNNDLDVQGGSLASLTSQIHEGYNAGRWNGAGGIISTTAAADTTHLTTLGIIQNNQSGIALFTAAKPFDTYTPAANDILLKYTYYGDTNLDGKVDGSDYSRIDSAFIADKTNPTAQTGWYNGDFNYDGVINGSDYTLIDNAFNTQGASVAATLASPTAVATDQIAATAAVPEPASLALLAIAAAAMLSRRKTAGNIDHACDLWRHL